MVLLLSMRGLCLALLLLTSVAFAADNKSLSRQLSRLDSSSGSSDPDSPISVLPSSFKSGTKHVHNKDLERVKEHENTLTNFEQEDPKSRKVRLDKIHHRAKQFHSRLSTLRPSRRSNSPSHQEKLPDEGTQSSSDEEERKTVDLVDLAGGEKGEKPSSAVTTSPSLTASFSHQSDHSPSLEEKPVIEKEPDPKPFYGPERYFDNQEDREKVHEREAHPKHSLREEHSRFSSGEAVQSEEGLYKREKIDPEKEMDDGHIEKRGHGGVEAEEEGMKGAALPSTSERDPRPLSPSARTPISPIHSPRTAHEDLGRALTMQDRLQAEIKTTSPARDTDMLEASTPSKTARKRKQENLAKKISNAAAEVITLEAVRKQFEQIIGASRLGRRNVVKILNKTKKHLRCLQGDCPRHPAKSRNEDGANVPSEPPREEEKVDLLSDSSAVPHMISSSSTNSDSDTEREKKAHKAQTRPEQQQQQQQDALWRRGLGDGKAEESGLEEGEIYSDEDDKGKGKQVAKEDHRYQVRTDEPASFMK